jgi:hypothetical protein
MTPVKAAGTDMFIAPGVRFKIKKAAVLAVCGLSEKNTVIQV